MHSEMHSEMRIYMKCAAHFTATKDHLQEIVTLGFLIVLNTLSTY